MNLSVFNRKFCVVLSAAALLMSTAVPQAHASGWGDLLQPLVRDVIIPGAKIGVQKWTEHKNKTAPAATSTTTSNPGVVEIPPESTDAIIISPDGAAIGAPTPDGPDAVSSMVSAVTSSSAPPPPPPPVSAP